MKLRTNKNSIRLRLSLSEVNEFKEFGIVNETLAFSNAKCHHFHYSLIQADHETISVTFLNNHLRVYIPLKIADKWCTSDDVGFDYSVFLSESESLYVLVEKDFQCLTERSNEDESDNFPNPNLNAC